MTTLKKVQARLDETAAAGGTGLYKRYSREAEKFAAGALIACQFEDGGKESKRKLENLRVTLSGMRDQSKVLLDRLDAAIAKLSKLDGAQIRNPNHPEWHQLTASLDELLHTVD